MSPRKKFILIYCIILFFSLIGCNKTEKKEIMKKPSEKIKVKINEFGTNLQKRYPERVRINHQPVGATFYKIDWGEENKGKIIVDAGQHSFEINDVMGFTGSETDDQKNEGMSQLDIFCGITGEVGISHQDARKKFFEILTALKNAGWKSTISFEDPRLNGEDMLNYIFTSNATTTLPADYQPSIDEWMRIEDLTTWEFYADHTFAQVNFMRDATKMDKSKLGAYIINITLISDLDYFRGFVNPSNREKWRELLPAALKEAAERRKLLEAELRLKGVHIDETYQDPPVPIE